MSRMTAQEKRNAEEYKKKLNAQIGFFKPTCVLNGVRYGYCSGPLKTYSKQGHGLCQRHQEIVQKEGRVELGSGFFIEVAHA